MLKSLNHVNESVFTVGENNIGAPNRSLFLSSLYFAFHTVIALKKIAKGERVASIPITITNS